MVKIEEISIPRPLTSQIESEENLIFEYVKNF